MTINSKKISFSVDHIDPLGQGVSKLNDQITFIPKTLPGEKGSAIIYKKSKGVNFATIDSICHNSKLRITPNCPHYNECQGCHFLHCSHESELEFKRLNLKRLIERIDSKIEPEVISLESRFHYRNRIQLHYDVRKKELGYINKYNKRIHHVAECLLPHKKISSFLKNWYETHEWVALAKKQKPKGHVELLLKDNEIKVNWNQRYSSGGFTQVNEQMNTILLKLVENIGNETNPKSLVDLFAGNGNLTNKIKDSTQCKRVALDLYPHGKESSEFITCDLDQDSCLDEMKENSPLLKTDLLVVDPPRKGFRFLGEWCDYLSPNHIIYVSCNPATLIRDLQSLKEYKLQKVLLLDMFASTYHYETVVVLKKF